MYIYASIYIYTCIYIHTSNSKFTLVSYFDMWLGQSYLFVSNLKESSSDIIYLPKHCERGYFVSLPNGYERQKDLLSPIKIARGHCHLLLRLLQAGLVTKANWKLFLLASYTVMISHYDIILCIKYGMYMYR